MANQENLKIIRSTARAREVGRKGGLVRSKAKTLNRRKYCTKSCPLYPCWAEVLKTQYPVKGKNKYYCPLKRMPKSIQRKTTDMMSRGEEGFNQQLINLLIRWGNDVALVPRHVNKNGQEVINYAYLNLKQRLIDETIKVKDSIFGKREKQELSINDESLISINDLIKIFNKEKHKEVKKE